MTRRAAAVVDLKFEELVGLGVILGVQDLGDAEVDLEEILDRDGGLGRAGRRGGVGTAAGAGTAGGVDAGAGETGSGMVMILEARAALRAYRRAEMI